MKKILVVNPNTSKSMTKSIEKTITKLNTNYDITVINPNFGSESLESFYDYQIAASEIIKILSKNQVQFQGILIACFGDPGLYSIKEISDCPVVGIAEASLSMSLLLGKKFSILTALNKAVYMMEDMVNQYGLSSRLSSIRAVNSNVLDIENNKGLLVENFIEQGKKCIQDGAEVLILGCASMTGIREKIEERLKIPVIDPVIAGYKMLQMLIESSANISKIGLYMSPPKGLL
ncbi:aspartate/glutamate racemase family protein [Clostridium tyrobutyricum]|uniref:aspartate/glutamate racemase family protein n=1 Tax=Clostridium tyrobutyricum TaxID=1519 RepID=UPI001C37F4B6|nr:aspartate/glutamate racemase family protein [Clostridium tyrobutyricum]MBV4427523.1 aspartate/glutamate racemase family protein [Clostridium tyrobutyricum]MBV4442740.1 aspartate/glutamate racemase family protein [Clostridium tyrobutyricum]